MYGVSIVVTVVVWAVVDFPKTSRFPCTVRTLYSAAQFLPVQILVR